MRRQRDAGMGGQPFQVDSSVRNALQGGQLTDAQVLEGRIIVVLTTIFATCILEGIIVGASVRCAALLAFGISACTANQPRASHGELPLQHLSCHKRLLASLMARPAIAACTPLREATARVTSRVYALVCACLAGAKVVMGAGLLPRCGGPVHPGLHLQGLHP